MSGGLPARFYEVPGRAATYREGRALPLETTRQWVDVIRRAVGTHEVRLAVDVGAGTGRFTRILAEALGAPVVAVEPPAGMTAERETNDDASIRYVRGVAEALPMERGVADVIQMSMVYHQLRDAPTAVAEMRRALRVGGLALVRTPTHETLSEFEWLRFFPETLDFTFARMPAQGDLLRVFTRAGLPLHEHTVIRQRIADNLAEYAARIRRRVFSSHQALPEDVWERRLAEFETYCRSASDRPVDEPVSLFVFQAAARDRA
jgi:ubiquinone/menaquinone biosynthesis C-methylase UbiE